jgi:hypothetical protein
LLDLIDQTVRAAACPVIAILETDDRDFINEAAKRGAFAYIANGDAEQLQSSIDIVLRRFAEFQNLEGAFARRALIERAKGILMERAMTLMRVLRSKCCGRTCAARVASWPTSPARSWTAERSCPARRPTLTPDVRWWNAPDRAGGWLYGVLSARALGGSGT